MIPLVISAPAGGWDLDRLDPKDGRQVIVLESRRWEVDHLVEAAQMCVDGRIDSDRFVFLKESTGIVDHKAFWESVDKTTKGAWLIAKPACYLGVFDANHILEALGDVTLTTKLESIQWEFRLHRTRQMRNYQTIWPEITENAAKRIETGPDGTVEYVIGNGIFEKYKGTAGCKICFRARLHFNGPGTSSGVCCHRIAQANAVEAGMSISASLRLLRGPCECGPRLDAGQVLLVRHGECDWNAEGRHLRREDRPLTAAGIAQAKATAQSLVRAKPKTVLSSPLRRAYATACIIAAELGASVEIVDDLAERDEHETVDDASGRAAVALKTYVKSGEVVVAVTHAGVIKGLTGSDVTPANGSIQSMPAQRVGATPF